MTKQQTKEIDFLPEYKSAGAVPPRRRPLTAADLREMGLGQGWATLTEILEETRGE